MSNLLTFNEAHEFLRISGPTLRRWMGQRRVGFYKVGSKVVFDPEELMALVTRGRVPPKLGRPRKGAA